MDAPAVRKRAVIACSYCRKRKRRCDGAQPICSLCRSADKRCVYPAASSNSLSNDTNPDRLAQLESVLAEHTRILQSLSEQTHVSANNDSLLHRHAAVEAETPATVLPVLDMGTPVDFLGPMTIPIGHGTTTGDLLQMRPVSAMVGDYPSDIFLRIEQKRELPRELSLSVQMEDIPLPSFESSVVEALVERYFESVHPGHPVLRRDEFDTIVSSPNEHMGEYFPQVALVLMVLAVAAAHVEPTVSQSQLPGIEYLRPGLQYILRVWPDVCHTDVHLAQALFLAALYYGCLCRPIQAWRLVHMASTNIQHAFFQRPSLQQQDLIRTCWAVFVLECDLVADYHLPRSGIENLIDQLAYPDCGSVPQGYESSWLANISARRLLNRIHCTIYASNAFGDTHPGHRSHPILALSDELAHQLGTWWDLVPTSVKPDLNTANPSLGEAILLLRYHACGDIICRPFLHYVCSQSRSTQPPDNNIMIQAITCLEHCRAFLRIVSGVLRHRSPSAGIYLHATLAALVNLAVASYCALLRDHVPDMESLEDQAISILEPWALAGSSAQAMLRLAIAVKDKGRVLRMME